MVPCDAITIPLVDLLPWQEGPLHASAPYHARNLPLRSPPAPAQPYFAESRYSRPRFRRDRKQRYTAPQSKAYSPRRRFHLSVNYG